jgi:hypothetical protein
MSALRIHLFTVEVVVTSNWLVLLAIVLILCAANPCVSAQNPRIPPSQLPENPSQPTEDETRTKMERDMAKKANQERHAALKKDTDKLLKLSTELKEYVDRTNENMLSMDVIKKAEEIEKLAHSVRDKMKGN